MRAEADFVTNWTPIEASTRKIKPAFNTFASPDEPIIALRTSDAAETESAQKKIQAKQTTWNVSAHLTTG